MSHLQYYVDYINNTGLDGKLTTEQFDDDHEPIGPKVRMDMQRCQMITIENGKIKLKPGLVRAADDAGK